MHIRSLSGFLRGITKVNTRCPTSPYILHSFSMQCKSFFAFRSIAVPVKFLYLKNISYCTNCKWFSTSLSSHSRLARSSVSLSTLKKLPKEECSAIFIKNNGKLRKTRQKLKETTKKVTEGIKENVFTVPNGLCILRIGLAPVLAYLVLDGSYTSALGIFLFAGVTDLLDGFIARSFPSQQSMIGSFLDPMADKLLVATLFMSLTVTGLIPIPLTALIIARDSCLVVAGFFIRYHSLPPPRTFSRYFDVTLATVKLSPTLLSKVNTALQLSLAAVTLASPVFHYVDHPYIHSLWYIVASTTVLSGINYIFTKDTYKFIRSYPSRKLFHDSNK